MPKTIIEQMKIEKDIDEIDAMNALVLAYIGDGVYELYVRTRVVSIEEGKVNEYHKEVVTYVKASSQAFGLSVIEERLTDSEMAIVRRGKNNKNLKVPKNGNRKDYRDATGFEALLGYLYLSNEHKRLNELLEQVVEQIEERKIEG